MRLKKIEIWDFECHKHSLFDNLDAGLNLIFGDSDAGKTSMVRALKLVAYNEFDPACVRLGAKNCKVHVETERGYVHVTRGKVNIWKTCRIGETEQEFTKIGKNILPEAAMIIGLHLISLGDIKLPINIMDQDESHFMLNELGGDSASGSMRAQIIDEISGCSGIEGLIKDVSLDRHRFGRSLKEQEDHAKLLRESMHDNKFIEDEDVLLSKVQVLINDKNDCDLFINELTDIFEEHNKDVESMEEITEKLKKMPHTKILKAILSNAEKSLNEINRLSPLSEEYLRLTSDLDEAQKELDKIPDLESVGNFLSEASDSVIKSKAMTSFYKEHATLERELLEAKEQFDKIPDLDEIKELILDCQNKFDLVEKAQSWGEDLLNALDEMDDAEDNCVKADENLKIAMMERSEALSKVDVCPLTQQSISKECSKSLKFPVIEVSK